MKWFKKISDLFKVKDSSQTEKIKNELSKLFEHKISYDTYKKLMYDHEIFHFDDKDWIIFNIDTNLEKIELYTCTLYCDNIKLKLRSIEDDPRMSLELDCVARKFENIIDVDKYINKED